MCEKISQQKFQGKATFHQGQYVEGEKLNYPFCTNHCGRRTNNEYGVCKYCVKILCTPLDGIIQIEGHSYGDKK